MCTNHAVSGKVKVQHAMANFCHLPSQVAFWLKKCLDSMQEESVLSGTGST